ncbi:serine hydrolase [Burkholderia ubonensis]|uniref:serine hydrolase n=1 Tax=Burkholderia ubonensis TaxID=101571 RepID=UPI0039F54BA6
MHTLKTRLAGLDEDVVRLLEDWHVPGIGIGIVVGDQLLFSGGFGFRDWQEKLPFTPKTVFPIASNGKLFTAVAAGMLVEEGKLHWDEPICRSIPSLRFFNDELNNHVSLRDMLSHRTGITRHDMLWYKSDFSLQEKFERIRYLEPKAPLRGMHIYNNLMYEAVGHLIAQVSGKPWNEFVTERILEPLEMTSTVFTIQDMLARNEYAVPFSYQSETRTFDRDPYYEDRRDPSPAGAICANIDDLSHWMIALMNQGMYQSSPVLPDAVLQATLEPTLALPNTDAQTHGFWELLNTVAGMGRFTASYRGYFLTFQGGNIDGFRSQVAVMPRERIGVSVLVIGDAFGMLPDILTYDIYERLLQLDKTPWSERWLAIQEREKRAKEYSASIAPQKVPNTSPSHPLIAYTGSYEHPVYGPLHIALRDGNLYLEFRGGDRELIHYHYDRFDTESGDEKWSVNFRTGAQGDIDEAVMLVLDEKETVFARQSKKLDPLLVEKLRGHYRCENGESVEIASVDGSLRLSRPSDPETPEERLLHCGALRFRAQSFSSMVIEFHFDEQDTLRSLTQTSPLGCSISVRL